MVGEIRDHDTAEMALRAAMTGHLLLSTLHTSDAVSVVSRLVDLGVEPTLVGASLAGVLSQRLVRTICTECRETYTPAPELMREFFDETPTDFKWYRGRGCHKCDFSGYKGRRIVAELWIPSNADVILINKSAPRDELVKARSTPPIQWRRTQCTCSRKAYEPRRADADAALRHHLPHALARRRVAQALGA